MYSRIRDLFPLEKGVLLKGFVPSKGVEKTESQVHREELLLMGLWDEF